MSAPVGELRDAKGRLPALPSLTGLRFAAAFAVFLLHSVMFVQLFPFMETDSWKNLGDVFPMQLGATGVAFFFVLSGFIIDWSYNSVRDLRHPVATRRRPVPPGGQADHDPLGTQETEAHRACADDGNGENAVMTTPPLAVTVAAPPPLVLRLTNPVLNLLLRSPTGKEFRKRYRTLTFTGRKSGELYTFPIRTHHVDGNLYAVTNRCWRLNFRGGLPARITYDDRTSEYQTELVEDPATVAELLMKLTNTYSKCAQPAGAPIPPAAP
ncbi:hypothetical protein [Nocardia sp. NPDC052112]|uniref:acyltransferase family protein n=1 Tax=Nocardia sp. NPDC052112 TaxID=3155646 RepID=UPI003420CAAA